MVYGLIALSQHIDTLVLGRQKPDTIENDYFNAAGPEEKHFDILSSALVGSISIRTLKLRCYPTGGLLEKIASVFVEQAKDKRWGRLYSLKIRTEFVNGAESKISNFCLFAQTLASNNNFLKYLELTGDRINDKDMEVLTGLGCSPTSLLAIKICYTSIMDQGVHILHDLSFLTPISINIKSISITPTLLEQINKDDVAKKLNDADWEPLKKLPFYFSLLPQDVNKLTQKFYGSAIRQVTSFFKSSQKAGKPVPHNEISDLSITPD